jgi:hypothetical protein
MLKELEGEVVVLSNASAMEINVVLGMDVVGQDCFVIRQVVTAEGVEEAISVGVELLSILLLLLISV